MNALSDGPQTTLVTFVANGKTVLRFSSRGVHVSFSDHNYSHPGPEAGVTGATERTDLPLHSRGLLRLPARNGTSRHCAAYWRTEPADGPSGVPHTGRSTFRQVC